MLIYQHPRLPPPHPPNISLFFSKFQLILAHAICVNEINPLLAKYAFHCVKRCQLWLCFKGFLVGEGDFLNKPIQRFLIFYCSNIFNNYQKITKDMQMLCWHIWIEAVFDITHGDKLIWVKPTWGENMQGKSIFSCSLKGIFLRYRILHIPKNLTLHMRGGEVKFWGGGCPLGRL